MSHSLVSTKTYVTVFGALLVLLAFTVAAARIENPTLNLIVGLSIACAKAALIMVFFMHLRASSFVIRLVAAAGFVWLAILMTLTMSDYWTRG